MNKGVVQLAREAGISKSLVSRKLKEGKSREQILAEAAEHRARLAERGQLPPAPASPEAESGNVIDGETFASAQRRKETALANLRELELQERRGVLVNAEQVELEWVMICGQVRDAVLAIPEKLSDTLAAIHDPVEVNRILTAALREELARISKKLRTDDDSRAA